MYALLLAAAIFAPPTVPDGTLLFSECDSFIGRQAKIVTNDWYTHVAIVLDGCVYEADLPRVKCSPFPPRMPSGATIYVYTPRYPYSPAQVQRMRRAARGRLGEPYRLYNYWHRRPIVYGTWCSRYVGDVLSSSGRYYFTPSESHEPETLRQNLRGDYRFEGVINYP